MTVIRVVKSKEFVTIHTGILEDPKISFKAKGLWTYCMSRPNDWTFYVSHLSKVSKDGEDSVYSAIKELQEAGYIERVQENVNGRFQKMDYVVYERPRIKEKFPQPDFPDAVRQDAENPALPNIDNIPNIDKKKNVQGPFSDRQHEVDDVYSFLIESLKKTKPDLKVPRDSQWNAWKDQLDLMIRRDKRDVEKIKRVLEWLPSSAFWRKNILSADSLRKQFDKLELEMSSQSGPKNDSNASNLLQRVEKVISHHKWNSFYCGPDYVEFSPGNPLHYESYKLKDPGFIPSVLNLFKKKNVSPKIMEYLEGKTDQL